MAGFFLQQIDVVFCRSSHKLTKEKIRARHSYRCPPPTQLISWQDTGWEKWEDQVYGTRGDASHSFTHLQAGKGSGHLLRNCGCSHGKIHSHNGSMALTPPAIFAHPNCTRGQGTAWELLGYRFPKRYQRFSIKAPTSPSYLKTVLYVLRQRQPGTEQDCWKLWPSRCRAKARLVI